MFDPSPPPSTGPAPTPPGAAAPGPRPWARLFRRGFHLVLPDPCLGCGVPLEKASPYALCLRCRGRLRRHRPGCGRCGAPLPGDRVLPPGVHCSDCRRTAPPFAALLSPWRYEPPLVAVVHGLKFARCGYLGERLGHPLADWLREAAAEAGGGPPGWRPRDGRPPVDLVVPVPLHPIRRWRRGYNQAERIGRPLARHLEVPFASPLRRRQATRTQARLPRSRRHRNVEGAFRMRRGGLREVRGQRVLLVDDVCTTGATLAAAARTLREAGARRVVAVTVARTPPPTNRTPPPAEEHWRAPC